MTRDQKSAILAAHLSACDVFGEAVQARNTEKAVHAYGVAKGIELVCTLLLIEVAVPIERTIAVEGERVTRLT